MGANNGGKGQITATTANLLTDGNAQMGRKELLRDFSFPLSFVFFLFWFHSHSNFTLNYSALPCIVCKTGEC